MDAMQGPSVVEVTKLRGMGCKDIIKTENKSPTKVLARYDPKKVASAFESTIVWNPEQITTPKTG